MLYDILYDIWYMDLPGDYIIDQQWETVYFPLSPTPPLHLGKLPMWGSIQHIFPRLPFRSPIWVQIKYDLIHLSKNKDKQENRVLYVVFVQGIVLSIDY